MVGVKYRGGQYVRTNPDDCRRRQIPPVVGDLITRYEGHGA
jgi:hypothetical protein